MSTFSSSCSVPAHVQSLHSQRKILSSEVSAANTLAQARVKRVVLVLRDKRDKSPPGFQAAAKKPSALATSFLMMLALLPSASPPPKTGLRTDGPWPFAAPFLPLFPSWKSKRQHGFSNYKLCSVAITDACLLQTNCWDSLAFATKTSQQGPFIVGNLESQIISRGKPAYCK